MTLVAVLVEWMVTKPGACGLTAWVVREVAQAGVVTWGKLVVDIDTVPVEGMLSSGLNGIVKFRLVDFPGIIIMIPVPETTVPVTSGTVGPLVIGIPVEGECVIDALEAVGE
ncbi:hypothetical protein BDV32DRAFT_127885 [Aspergillus pseudonomiae]|nr:hypothetical protein BDV32DRAFT_127885 [Aspergillus pseudonomiae]